MTLPIIENTQTISVATIHVLSPFIEMPSDNRLVINSPTKVVTSAIPPIRYGALVNAIFAIRGPRIVVAIENINTAVTKDTPLIEKPSTNAAAAAKPSAFAKILRISLANKIIMPSVYASARNVLNNLFLVKIPACQ